MLQLYQPISRDSLMLAPAAAVWVMMLQLICYAYYFQYANVVVKRNLHCPKIYVTVYQLAKFELSDTSGEVIARMTNLPLLP